MEDYIIERMDVLKSLYDKHIVFSTQLEGLEFLKNNLRLITNKYIHCSDDYRSYCLTEKGHDIYNKLATTEKKEAIE
ncbi:MAG TPA: hypothetical protein PLV83_02900 [Bacilli bacterium]|nr:hypothetical protein [Bacilli bacterium]